MTAPVPGTPPSTAEERLPWLSAQEMRRLVDIAFGRDADASVCPKWTESLYFQGVVDIDHAMPGENARAVRLTSLGIRVLAGFPGEEFDMFRALLKDPQDA